MPSDPLPNTPDPDDNLIGQVIAERFLIAEPIGRGSMGRVYRAEQRPLGQAVAVKVLDVHAELAGQGSFGERFIREAAVLAKLTHPNTVRVYDFGVWNGRSYLVMEYIEGTSLAHLLAEGPMVPRRALEIGIQISASLREAHQIGIVHRDLKASNILIAAQCEENDFVKVIDFGLGKQLRQTDQDLTMAGQILGSPLYIPPEQILGRPVDQRADIYSLGILLFQAFTGARPYTQRGAAALMSAHLYDTPLTFKAVDDTLDLPPQIEETIQRCLAKAPEARFEDAGALYSALRACLKALDDGPPPSLAAAPAPAAASRWGLYLIVAAAVLAAALLMGIAAVSVVWMVR